MIFVNGTLLYMIEDVIENNKRTTEIVKLGTIKKLEEKLNDRCLSNELKKYIEEINKKEKSKNGISLLIILSRKLLEKMYIVIQLNYILIHSLQQQFYF